LGFHCAGLLGACFFALPPFSGARSEIHQTDPCCQHVKMVCCLFFNFAALFDFGCCSLAKEMSFVDCYLPYFRHWLITHPSAFPVFVYWKFTQRSAPCPFPLLRCAYSTPPPLLHVPFQVLIYCSVCLFCRVGGQSVHRAMLVYPRGGCGNTAWHLVLTCWSARCLPSKLELTSGSMGALQFSQCNVAWRNFVWAGSSGGRSFDSFWCFISAKGGSRVSAWFLIYRAHTVCFCTLVAILDPLLISFFKEGIFIYISRCLKQLH
jgi:hypothetical protein